MATEESQAQPVGRVLLTIGEAAKYMAVSEDTVRKLIRGGKVPHVRINASNIRIRIRDLDEYINSQTSRTWKPMPGRGPATGYKMSA